MMKITSVLAVVLASAPVTAVAQTVSLACSEADGSRNVDLTFDPNGRTADVVARVTNVQGRTTETAAVANLTASPTMAVITFRDSHMPNVYVDYRYEVNRVTLAFDGRLVMPGYMNESFTGTCQVRTQAPVRRAF